MHLNYKFEYSNNFIDLFKKDIYENYVLDIMNASTRVFPYKYEKVIVQSNGDVCFCNLLRTILEQYMMNLKKKLILKTEKYMLFFVLAKRMYLQLENWEDILRIIFDAIVWSNIFRAR